MLVATVQRRTPVVARLGGVVVALVLVASCSSTERSDDAGPSAAGVAVETVDGGAVTESVTDAPGSATSTIAGTPPDAPGTAGGVATAPSPSPGAPPTQTTPGGFAHLRVGKGIDDETIKLGIAFADAAAYNRAGQALGGTPGFEEVDDPKGIQNAVIEYFNSSGGIAGRKIEPVWHELLVQNAVTKEGRTRDAQEACATYTEDNEVFAIMGTGQWTEQNIIECAVRTDTPYVDGVTARTGVWASDRQAQEFGRHYYTISMFTTDRRERALVAGLQRLGFFDADTKVGILVEDSPAFHHAVDHTLEPALAAAGVEVVEKIAYPDIIESPWQNYVLQFQAAGVTHVYFTASTAESWPTLLFMRGAENQAYRPKYAISGMPVSWLASNAPPEQLSNAMGIAWLPTMIEADSPAVSERDAVCRKVVSSKGYPELSGRPFCDFFWFVKDTLERAPELTPAGMQTAAHALGDAWMSTLTFGGRTRLGPGRHDGALLVRPFAWDPDGGRMVHRGEVFETP